LIVDEVLAVGDAEFQKKCLGKMGDVSKGEGRTVLFVSHNMAAVKNLCSKGIVLENGKVIFDGMGNNAIDFYLNNNNNQNSVLSERTDRLGSQKIKFISAEILNLKDNIVNEVFVADYLRVKLTYIQNEEIDFSKLIISLVFYDNFENIVCAFPSDEMGVKFEKSINNQIELIIPSIFLRPNSYSISIYSFLGVSSENSYLDTLSNAISFEVLSDDFYDSGKMIRNLNCAFIPGNYKI